MKDTWNPENAAHMETIRSRYETMTIEIDRLFVEYPELRPQFFSSGFSNGKAHLVIEPPSGPNSVEWQQRVEAMADLLLDYFSYGLSSDWFKRREPATFVRDVFRMSPALRERYRTVRHWYAPPAGQTDEEKPSEKESLDKIFESVEAELPRKAK